MEASSYYHPIKTLNLYSSLSIPKPKYSSIPSQPIHPKNLCLSLYNSGSPWRPNGRSLTAIDCAKGGPATELEEETMKAIIMNDLGVEEEENELVTIGGRWREICKEGGGGIVELMECLEREAIMGEDVGRDPTDYNRRAHIFDKSSRVFQALKESNNTLNKS
ncbi:hypothetical protein ACSBR1_008001 [Camellia fascicularis]